MTEARRRSRRRAARALGGLLCLAALLPLLGCDREDPRSAPEVGHTAPNFHLATLKHDRFYLHDQRGKSVVLIFWHTTCEVCKREMVELEALRKQLGDRKLAIAGVLNDPESVDTARRIVAGLALGFETLLDEGGKISGTYRVEQFPTTVLVTPEGKVGFYRVGYSPPVMHQLRDAIDSQL